VTTLDESAAVRRLFDRLGFGPRPGELADAVSAGFEATAKTLLNPTSASADPGVAETPEPDLGPEVVRPPAAQGDTAARRQATAAIGTQETTLAGWWLDRMVAVRSPLVERMTWFWHGHFATSEQKVRGPRLMQRQNDTLRTQGTGSFTTLARSLVVDPAMLVWLDGQRNTAKAPNENLARESMELFLLGIGHYTEDDVRAAARALTGWTVDRNTITSRFVPRRHDSGAVTVLGSTAALDAGSFVDLVLSQPDSARFVAGRVWFRLVSPTPPPDAVVTRLTAAYGEDRDVLALLRAVVAEPSFLDSTQTTVKQPVEWLVGLMRALGVRRPEGKAAAKTLLTGLGGMGQVPFEPPSVGGWPADVAWLTTSADLARLHLARAVAGWADLSSVRAVSAAARPDAVGALFGVGPWTPRTRSALAKVADNPAQVVAVAACAPEYVVSL
jgi:uncharacterized protein (DUF1800 family)